MGKIFPAQYKGGAASFQADESCFLIGWSPTVQEVTWAVASKELGLGGGILIVAKSGRKFYAETEGAPVCTVWAGEC